jgi:hypothetical protein
MTKVLIALTGTLLGVSGVQAQEPNWRVYQVLGPPIGGRALDEGFNSRVVRGKPFSGTEERRSLQVLGDGTRIENNQTNRLFRDSEGRTRVEEINGTVTIFDPVANFRVELNTSARTTRRVNNLLLTTLYGQAVQTYTATTRGIAAETTENLNPQVVNGVMAQGVRTTMTIPKGQVGNDREIKVVTERWVSNDLQMLVKSSNSDPRFGDTTYQLTGIVQQEPEASLFRIPDGYTEVGAGRGGGRSPVTPGGRGPAGGRGGRGTPGSVEPQKLLEQQN